MDINRILAAVDHTLLAQDAVWEQVKTLCDDGLRCHTASVCIPPSFVRQAKDYVGDRLAVCTVIGFPNGYSTTAVKCFETEDAVQNGADEIDMVINLGWVKEQNWDALLAEIRAVKAACRGKLLKVLVRHRLPVRGGLHQDLHRLRRRRGHPGGRGPLRPARRALCPDQGRRRHFRPPGRGGFPDPGRVPAGRQPDCQGGQGRRIV